MADRGAIGLERLKSSLHSTGWEIENSISRSADCDLVILDRPHQEAGLSAYLRRQGGRRRKIIVAVGPADLFELYTRPSHSLRLADDVLVLQPSEAAADGSVISARWGEMQISEFLNKSFS